MRSMMEGFPITASNPVDENPPVGRGDPARRTSLIRTSFPTSP